jgi:hypothetical protein
MGIQLWSPAPNLSANTYVPLTQLMTEQAAANTATRKDQQETEDAARVKLIQSTIGKHSQVDPATHSIVIDRPSVLAELSQRDPVAASQAQQHFTDLDTASTAANDKHVTATDTHGKAVGEQTDRNVRLITQALGNIDPAAPDVEAQWNSAVSRLRTLGVPIPDDEAKYTPEALHALQSTLIDAKTRFTQTKMDARAQQQQASSRYQWVTVRDGDGTTHPHILDRQTGQIDTIAPAAAGLPATPPTDAPAHTPGQSAPAAGNVDGGFVWDHFTRSHEGGLNPHDANGAPTLYGFNKTANPDINFDTFTPADARQRFIDKYYKPSGADSLPANMRAVYADTYFISPGMARSILARAGNDPQKFMDLREAWQSRLVDSPGKEGNYPWKPYAKAWGNRNKDLRTLTSRINDGVANGAPAEGAATPAAGPGGAHVDMSRFDGKPKPEDANPLTDDDVKFMAGRMFLGEPMPQFSDRQSKNKPRILHQLATLYQHAGISPGEAVVFAAQNKAGMAELLKLSQLRSLVEPYEATANMNLDQVLANKGGLAGSVPVFNRYIQAAKNGFKGDPSLARLHVALVTFTNEYAKVMTAVNNAPLSDSARKEAATLINGNMTPEQMSETIKQMKIDMRNRITGINGKRESLLHGLRTGEGAVPTGNPVDTISRIVDGPNGTKWRQYKDGRPMERVRQ